MKPVIIIVIAFVLLIPLPAFAPSHPEYVGSETMDFENCNGFLSIEDVKSVIGDIDDLAVYSSAFMPVDGEPGLKTTCRATFESSEKTIGMTLVVMDSTDAAIALYQKNFGSISGQDFEIREYLTFWNNFDVVLNDQGLGSLIGSQYDKFFINFHTSLDQDKRALANVEQLRILSTIVQKKILDLDDVSISPPNPVLDNDVGLTTYEPPISPPSLPPVEEGMLLSPKKQSSQGIEPAAVTCKEGLVLIIKHDGSPACVKHETAESLEERGWGVIPPPCCKTIHHDALDISQEFIISSPTFAFDGMDESLNLELVAIRESFPEQYVVEGEFSTLHGGYGDRTDQMIDQVITQHKMNLVVISGQVTSAIIDGKWNELEQTQLPWTPT